MVGSTSSAAEVEAEDTPSGRIGNVRWSICAMLFAAFTINYMDRTALALLKPTLMLSTARGGIGLTEQGYSYLVDAFFVAYTIGLLFSGRIIDKVGTRVGFLAIMSVRTLAVLGHGLTNTVMEFGVARFMLGLGEAGSFPAAIKTVAGWFPQKERALATGIFNSGTNVGNVLAALTVPWVIMHYGWHATFLLTGALSTSWLLVWYLLYRRPGEHPTLSGRELNYIREGVAATTGPSLPWIKLIGYRQTWAYTVGKSLTDPVWWFLGFYIPSYFNQKFNLDLVHLGLPVIACYSASALGSVFGGWLPAPFLRLGMKPNNARLAAMLACAILVLPICTVAYVNSEWVAIGIFSLVTAAHQGWSANLFTTTSDMFPRSCVASVTGIGSMAGSAFGVALITFAGYSLQHSHSYALLFMICGSAYLLALLIMMLLAPGLKRVEFYQ
jgi:ACS family hexuronate transporter-like MFS transporter